jgi:hypothetical protein
MSAARQILEEYPSFYGLAGGIASSGSIINLATKLYQTGLAPMLQELLDWYRKIVHLFTDPLMELISKFLPFPIPGWYHDLYVISFILCTLYFRSVFRHMFPRLRFSIKSLAIIVLSGLFSLIVFGFVLFALSLFFLVKPPHSDAADSGVNPISVIPHVARLFFVSLGVAVVVTVVFFAANSQL